MILRAEYIWTGRGELIRDGAIRIENGHIDAVRPFGEMNVSPFGVEDLGHALLMPAMINAHTHLDLSHLDGKLVESRSFSQWLKRVARARMVTVFEGRSIRKGIDQVIAGGSATVGDVSVSGKSATSLRRHGLLKSVVYCETYGLDPASSAGKAAKLRRRIEALLSKPAVRVGISPHAPYSVSPDLFARCLGLANEYGLPMAVHAAESDIEAEFLVNGTGELRALLENYGLLPPGWKPPGMTPVHYLESLGVLEAKPMLIHCSHVSAAEAQVVARAGCSVAFCPRSNAFFRRSADSLQTLLAAEANVAIGTDSLASNETLSMLDEMVFLKGTHPELAWQTIFEMATINGARALGYDQGGILAEGLPANITAISLPAVDGQESEPAALNVSSAVLFTMIHGEKFTGRPRGLQKVRAVTA